MLECGTTEATAWDLFVLLFSTLVCFKLRYDFGLCFIKIFTPPPPPGYKDSPEVLSNLNNRKELTKEAITRLKDAVQVC